MHADYSVELGPDDDVLEIPWSSPNGSLRYYDLVLHPELVAKIPEATAHAPLREFLVAINRDSIFRSAKCDVWFSEEMSPDEEIYGSCKFGSYVDLVVSEGPDKSFDPQLSFGPHEHLLKKLVRLLAKTPESLASAEFILRRCYFHGPGTTSDGFYMTLYVFGYGDEPRMAQQNWEVALQAVLSVLLGFNSGSA